MPSPQEDAEAQFNLGTTLHYLGKQDEAIECFKRALVLAPDKAQAVSNIGAALQSQGKIDEATSMFRQAIAMQPRLAEAHYNLGLAMLLRGDYEAGWKKHEYRLAIPNFFDPPRSFGVPMWDGSELRGRTILIHAEQGYGDTIQFVRYVPEVVKRGGRVLLVVRRELERLFQGENSQGANVISRLVMGSEPLHVHLPLMSLPLVLGIHEPLADRMSYISANLSQPAPWGDLLRDAKGLRVGLVWAGNSLHKGDRHRSVSLEMLAPLARPDVTFVSLQVDASSTLPTPHSPLPTSSTSAIQLIDPTQWLVDFADTARLIAELDLVICVDTAVAHLAGAMGKTVWILLPFAPDWRWGLRRANTPWYTSARLFRQTTPGSWQEPVAEMAIALEALAKQGRPAHATHVGSASRTSVLESPRTVRDKRENFSSAAGALAGGNRIDATKPPARAPAALKSPNFNSDSAYPHQNSAEAHYNLGNALREKNRLEEAVVEYRRAIEIRPDLAEAYNNLGNALYAMRRHEEAIEAYQTVIRLKPTFAKAYNNLASVMQEAGQFDQALGAIDRAIAIQKDYVIAHTNRGVILRELGRLDDAMNAFRHAIQYSPDSAAALNNLASILKGQGRYHELIETCKWIIARKPNAAAAYNQLANARWLLNELDAALADCNRALAITANLAEAHNTLGNIHRDMGNLDAALASFRRAVELNPAAADMCSNLAYTVHFHPDYDSAAILAINRQWALRHEQPLIPKTAFHSNDRSTNRKLRIGYVSPDFRGHCASFFLMPLLANHDPDKVEVVCYSGVTQPDAVTAAFKELGHLWRESAHLADARLAEQIRADKIDILVDLTLHMGGNRLLVFARKPAPVQVTWLGYPSTTGLSSIDYRLTDPFLDPPGQGDEFYSEKSIRLPHSFWCYKPAIATADPNSLPALTNGHITFGCFNNFVKVTKPTIDLWTRVLTEFPNSRLLILSPAGAHQAVLHDTFAKAGIAADRIEFVGRVSMDEYFQRFHRIDISLDTVPYPGHTTTLDSLWMGVPVVTMTGKTSCSRGGMSILTNVGLPELIAHDARQYIEIVRGLVGDLPVLAKLRGGLREKLQRSPLMDAKEFAQGVEQAYREMWEGVRVERRPSLQEQIRLSGIIKT